jgi:uncharacterized membrane protein
VQIGNPRFRMRLLTLITCLLCTLLLVVGCGGGKGTSTRRADASGRTVIALRWPEPTDAARLVPVASKSVRVALKDGATTVAERLLVRPAAPPWVTKVTIENVPVVTLSASATAYPNDNGTGTAQATVTAPVTVQATGDTELRLTMASTITRLELNPGGPLSIGIQETVALQAVPRDAANNIVLANAIQFNASPANIVEIKPNGEVRGLGIGTTTITAREPESGKSAQVAVTVSRSAFYRLTWIGGLSDALRSEATAMNDKGEVVGFSEYPHPQLPNDVVKKGWIWRTNENFTAGTFTELGNTMVVNDTLTETADQVSPSGINNAGQITGSFRPVDLNNSPSYGFLWNNGPLELRFWNAQSHGRAINNAAEIVGGTTFNTGLRWATGERFAGTAYFEESTPEKEVTRTEFTSLNDAGLICGNVYYKVQQTEEYQIENLAFTFQNNTRVFLPFFFGLRGSRALDINNKGHISGWMTEEFSSPGGGSTSNGIPCLWKEGVLNLIQLPSGFQSAHGVALNDFDTIALTAYQMQVGGAYLSTAFRWRYGKVEDLNKLIPAFFLTPQSRGRILYTTVDVNNKEQMCGTGEQGAYLLTPQPGTGGLSAGIR